MIHARPHFPNLTICDQSCRKSLKKYTKSAINSACSPLLHGADSAFLMCILAEEEQWVEWARSLGFCAFSAFFLHFDCKAAKKIKKYMFLGCMKFSNFCKHRKHFLVIGADKYECDHTNNMYKALAFYHLTEWLFHTSLYSV